MTTFIMFSVFNSFLEHHFLLLFPCRPYRSVPQTLARGPNLARGPHSTGPRGHAFNTKFPGDEY